MGPLITRIWDCEDVKANPPSLSFGAARNKQSFFSGKSVNGRN
jgi:hypothetical protein